MQFTAIVTLAASLFPFLAAASPLESRQTCSTAPIQCCQTTTTAGSAAGTSILDSIGVVVQDVNVLLGLTCSPISVVGVGSGDACDAQAVCCQDNSHGGLVSIGCVPVTL
ncbi:fungal hydrophobin [Epithele typhae]|uniref:fungal hydrophobin n=1 Tax=Epithele typhae TaxID=378194 RepID=UPI002008CBF0|nr:fungal hydrophobin [Epithele typhae]KAH9923698.1 fungal hydrophobin [Epithele typhae]